MFLHAIPSEPDPAKQSNNKSFSSVVCLNIDFNTTEKCILDNFKKSRVIVEDVETEVIEGAKPRRPYFSFGLHYNCSFYDL